MEEWHKKKSNWESFNKDFFEGNENNVAIRFMSS